MATRTELSLPQARVERIERDGDTVRIHMREFFSFVSLTGSAQQTQWRQAGVLVLEGVEDHDEGSEIPNGALVILGGDVHDNAYTYRDLVPMPLDARGHVGYTLRIEGLEQPFALRGTRLRLDARGERRYVSHVQ